MSTDTPPPIDTYGLEAGDENSGSENKGTKNADKKNSGAPFNSEKIYRAYSNYKFWAIGALSFVIPVIYFLQANALKQKELDNNENRHKADSLELVLRFYKDTSLTTQRLIAYENYQHAIDSMKLFFTPAFSKKDTIVFEQPSLTTSLLKISHSIDRLIIKIPEATGKPDPTVKKGPELPADYITQKQFNDTIAGIKKDISNIERIITGLKLPGNKSDSLLNVLRSFIPQLQFDSQQITAALANIDFIDTTKMGWFLTSNAKTRNLQRNITANKKTLEYLLEQIKFMLTALNNLLK